MTDELEKAANSADDAIAEYEDNPSPETAKSADWTLTRMRLLLGSVFEDLHYYVEREGEIIRYL